MKIEMVIKAEEEKIDFPMRRERYLSTWKIFRSISDENLVTAQHVLSLSGWQNCKSLLDLGCGDGLITKTVVLNSPCKIQKVVLVDPDKEMLDEAFMHIEELGIVPNIQKEQSGFEKCFGKYIGEADIILAVHLLYLVPGESFQLLLNSLPVGAKLIVIIDDETSIFTRLWMRTAQKYVLRSAAVRNTITHLDSHFSVSKTIITSRISNPLAFRDDIKESLLSLMSYSDFTYMSKDTQEFVTTTIKTGLKENYIQCASACYEITKIK